MFALHFVVALLPHAEPATDSVDLVEVNHCFDTAGSLAFDQIIFWELVDGEYRVVDWRLLRDVRKPCGPRGAGPQPPPEFIGGHATPVFDHHTKRWVSLWYDRKTNRTRKVVAEACRETWTQFDPELEDRAVLPVRRRRGLQE